MINAKMFATESRKTYRNEQFDIPNGEEGGLGDRPLIVQFCANDPQMLLQAAKIVEPHCDAVDINLGCPQDIARRGRYGSFLQDEWKLIHDMINILHVNLNVPVTAKFRVFPTVEKTVAYAKMLESAGAQILTCHGRTREQRGHNSGLADWEKIRAVKASVSVPVIANGNILFHSDIEACLAATGADAVMSAEGNLYNPAVFASSGSTSSLADPALPSTWCISSDTGLHPPHTRLALEYLAIVKSLKTRTRPSAVKGHLFKLLRPALGRETDLREQLGRVRTDKGKEGETWDKYEAIVKELDARMLRDAAAAEGRPVEDLVAVDAATGLAVLPHWLAQPYFRALPQTAAAALQENSEKQTETAKAAEREPNNAAESVPAPIPAITPSVEAEQPEKSVVGKRAPPERTPEPHGLVKRVKLSVSESPDVAAVVS